MSKKGIFGVVAVIVAVALLVLGVFLQRPAQPPAEPAKLSAPAAQPSAVTVGATDPFGKLACAARQYQDSLALAVTFTQPVDRRIELSRFIDVSDVGAGTGKGNDENQAKPAASAASAAGAAKAVRGAWVVGDNPRMIYFPYVAPQRRYTIGLHADLPGAGERVTLGAAVSCEVETDAMPPSFYFASRGVVLPAGQNGGLPVTTVNTPEVDVQFLRIAPQRVPEFFDTIVNRRGGSDADSDDGGDRYDDYYYYENNNRLLKGSTANWNLDRLNTLTTSVYQGRFLTDDKPNRSHVTFLPVEGIKELQEPGVYVAVMSQPGRFRSEYQATYFYVSDIGLHARRYAGRVEAYTVSLKQGQAIAGATVELVDASGKTLAKAAADERGHARFDGEFSKARMIRATRGKEMTVLMLGEPALDLSEFDVQGLPSVDNNLFVYAGRDLYRPGETFQVSVLPRDPDGRPLPGSPLTATLKRADGRVVQTALWKPDKERFGYVQHAVDLPPDAQTGTWMLELRVDPAARRADASWPFKVEEFLPERMKLALKADDGPLKPGAALHIDVQGDYLYGAPAAGNRLLMSFTVKRDRQAQPQKWPGFIFGDVGDDAIKHSEDLPESQLDGQGHGSADVDPGVANAHSPLKIRVSASLLESGGRPVVRSIERGVWPAGELIAVRPLFSGDVATEGAPAGFDLIRVDGAGQFAPLDQAQVRLFREDRSYYWRYDDQRGWNSGYTDADELVESRVLALRERTSLSLPVGYGRYRLEIHDPETGQTLKYRFYAGWGAQDEDAAGNRPDRVQMKLEGVPAQPGGKVQLTLTPPHDGQALVTVEGDRMLWSAWVPAKATGTQVEIPVDPSWKRHDLYVGAVVFRPGSAGDRVTPARAIGLAYLPIQTEGRQLGVHLSAPAKTLPETRATVKIKVDGLAGKPRANVTLSAVDVGILNIDQYQTPDPMGFFFGKHRYAPDLLDMYGKLIEKMDGTLGRLKWGGDAALRGNTKSLPKKVKLVDLFSGPVTLSEQGEAEIALDLPDFNGTLRLMAVAFNDGQYGNAEAEMTVAAPIVAELSTPRFIAPGDESAIALDVTNLSGAARQITVKLQANDPLAIAEGTRTLHLDDQQRETVRFTATTTGSYGLGLLRLTVDGQGGDTPVHIERESVLQVQPAQAGERQIRRARIAPGETLETHADWVAGYFPDSATVNLSLSSRPPINVQALVRDLLRYPYGCTEQTVSATLPWLLMDADTAERYKVANFSSTVRQNKVDGALARLWGMRASNGSYSLWGGDSANSRDVWLTAYATGFMQDARDRGFAVPDATLERSRQWLLQQVQQSGSGFGTWSEALTKHMAEGRVYGNDTGVLRDDHRHFAGLAAATLVLARDGKAPLSTVRQLFDRYQERARSPLPLVQLAAAFKLMGDEGRMKTALDQAMARPYGFAVLTGGSYFDDWLGDYGTRVRDLALSYALMAQYDLKHEKRELLLTDLADRLGERSYLSTQEQMALLLAARAAGGQQGAVWEMTLAGGHGKKILQTADDQSESLKPGDMGALKLVNTGSQPVYAELDIQGSATTPPKPRSDVIRLQRRWFHTDGKEWKGETLQTGDQLVAWIRAEASRPIADGLVVDRVPAGLEVENLNLTQNPDMNDWTIGGQRVAPALADTDIKHTEYRDDRYVAAVSLANGRRVDIFYLLRVVTPGKFAVPSTVAEDMYRPELRGVGEAWDKIEIRDRRPKAQGK